MATRILLVEDSKFLRLAAERALAHAGYEIFSASDGETALQIAREHKPHVILLDLLLPKINGLDVLKALKKDPATQAIAVVVLTGMSQKNEDRLRKDGAFEFLGKNELALDKGPQVLVNAVGEIVKKLKLEVPASPFAAIR